MIVSPLSSILPNIPAFAADGSAVAEIRGRGGVEVVPHEIGGAMDAAEKTKGPFLIDFRIDPEANVYPIVPLGKSLNDFWEAPDK